MLAPIVLTDESIGTDDHEFRMRMANLHGANLERTVSSGVIMRNKGPFHSAVGVGARMALDEC